MFHRKDPSGATTSYICFTLIQSRQGAHLRNARARTLRPWLAKVQGLVAERPQNFTKTVTAAEKKLLQEILEKALGVSRPKAAPRRVTRKSTAPAKRAPKKIKGRENSPF
jgi:hypothetical protein